VSFLIFCSYEPGGWPFIMADVLNRHGRETYYVSTAQAHGHDSTSFHRGDTDVSWNLSPHLRGTRAALITRARDLRNIARHFGVTACLGTGTRASLLADAGIKYKYWSYGSDLDEYCFWPKPPRAMFTASEWRRYAVALAGLRQARRSVCEADAVMIAPYQRDTLARVAPLKRSFFLPQIVVTETLPDALSRKKRSRERLRAEFCAHSIFFSSTRHVWGPVWGRTADNKANDVIVLAFAQYVRSLAKGRRSKLLLIKKGQSVAETMNLAAKLGASQDIVWLDPMTRDKLRDFYAGADVCLGQFGTPVTAFTTLEPMACATPTASFIGESLDGRVPAYRQIPPLCNSKDPVTIVEFMHGMTTDAGACDERGQSSWRWVSSNCSEDAFCEWFVRGVAG
jgi:hypothetical protein